MRGSIPKRDQRRQNRKLGVEVYEAGRFFTLTGRRISGAPEQILPVDLSPLCRGVFGPQEDCAVQTSPASRRTSTIFEEAIIDKALAAANGARFARLWGGDASAYPTRSEADLALRAMLAYWSAGDPVRVEALFGPSGLAREKWRTRPDYRERTIRPAIRSLPEKKV